MTDFFRFEEHIDIPFYNNNPELTKDKLIVMVIGIAIMPILLFSNVLSMIDSSNKLFSVSFFLIMIFVAYYICQGNLSLFFKKPKPMDIILIILCFLLYLIYSMLMAILLYKLGVPLNQNRVFSLNMDGLFWITAFLQILGEELFKLFIFILGMFLTYSHTKNRKLSIVMGSILTLLCFGLFHLRAYGSILQCILIIGLGGIFNLLAYLKTKNIIIPYIVHLLIDATGFIIAGLN